MPYCFAGGTWLCLVVAARETGPRRPNHLALTDAQISAASERLILDIDDLDGFALLLWPAQAFLHWPGGAVPVLARVLVEELRPPGTVHLPGEAITDHARLAVRLPNVRPPAVKLMLNRLHRFGFLGADPAGGYTLTIPDAPHPQRVHANGGAT
jgi:hypothetical protein